MKYAVILAGVSMLCVGAALHEARAQESIQSAKQRWKELTSEERQALEERFQKLKQLTPAERAALKNRHDVLQRLRHDDDGQQDDAARGPQKQPRARMNESIFKKLEKLEQQGGKQGREKFRAQMLDRVEDELLRMEEAGVLVPGESERLLELPPHELAAALRVKMKEFFFRNPPPRFAQLPENERTRLANLPPEQFGPEIHKALGKPDGGPKATRPDDGMPPPRPFLPKETFDRFLTPAQRAEIESLDKKERRGRVMRFLIEHARARLVERGEDPSVLEGLKGLPQFERQMRVLKILDPSFTPPPKPERFKKKGQGPPRGPRPEGAPPREKRDV